MTMITSNPSLSRGMKKVMLPSNGAKLSKLFESTKRNLLLEDIDMLTLRLSAGMPSPKPTRRKHNINFASQGKLKHMSGLANQQR